MTLQSEILDGLDVASWDDSVAMVKRTVANALRQLDRTATVTDTHYFNHSFVPDFVISWPGAGGRSRDLFLRLDTSASAFTGDVNYLGDTQPVLMGLTELDPVTAEAPTGPIVSDVRTEVMLTEPAAVEILSKPPQGAGFAHVLPSALLKGGRGVVAEETASELTNASERFFSGARLHDPGAVESAFPAFASHLRKSETDGLVNFGRIVWEATGGEPTAFPVPTTLARLDDLGLRFLLAEGPPDDLLFWRSIGRTVSLERLVNLGVQGGPNLAAFVRANGDRLYARLLMVKASQPRLDVPGPTWAIEAKALALHGAGFVAYLAPRRDDLVATPDDDGRGVDFPTFRTRTADEQVETVTVKALDGKTVTIESDDIFDPGTDETLASVGVMLPGATVQGVGLLVAGKHLQCDFATRTASGHTNAQFDILSLLERALPILWPLTDPADAEEIRTLYDVIGDVALPPTLFDEEPF